MTPDDRASYERQFEQAKRGLSKREVIHHARWEHGRLTVMVRRVEKGEDRPPEFVKRKGRGLQQTDLFA